MNSEWAQKNYDKLILIIATVLALLIAGLLLWQSLKFGSLFEVAKPKINGEIDKTELSSVTDASGMLTKPKAWGGDNLFVSGIVVEKFANPQEPGVLEPVTGGTYAIHTPITNEWVKKYSPPLDIARTDLKVLDPDGDGFNNLEEFQDNTDPSNAESHPPLIAKVCLVEMVPSSVQVTFMSRVDDKSFQINITEGGKTKSEFVTKNQTFGPKGYGFKLRDYVRKDVVDSQGIPKDLSEAKITYIQPSEGKSYDAVLQKGQSWDLPSLTAKLKNVLATAENEFLVRRGDSFVLSNDPTKERFKLTEITSGNAILTDGKGKTRPVNMCQ